MLFELFTTTEDLVSLQNPLAHRCQNPCLECQRELVDFSRNLAYPRAGSKTNVYRPQQSAEYHGNGLALLNATTINSNGQIVGRGTNALGQQDAFILTPVTPVPLRQSLRRKARPSVGGVKGRAAGQWVG